MSRQLTKRKSKSNLVSESHTTTTPPVRVTRRSAGRNSLIGGVSGVIGLEDHHPGHDPKRGLVGVGGGTSTGLSTEPARGEEENLIGYEWNRGSEAPSHHNRPQFQKRSRHHSPVPSLSIPHNQSLLDSGIDDGVLGWNHTHNDPGQGGGGGESSSGGATLNGVLGSIDGLAAAAATFQNPRAAMKHARPYPYGLTPYRYTCHHPNLPNPPPGDPKNPAFRRFEPNEPSSSSSSISPPTSITRLIDPSLLPKQPVHQQAETNSAFPHPKASTQTQTQTHTQTHHPPPDLSNTFSFEQNLPSSNSEFGTMEGDGGYESFVALLASHDGQMHGTGNGNGNDTSNNHGHGQGHGSGNGSGHFQTESVHHVGPGQNQSVPGRPSCLGTGRETTSGCIHKEGL